MDLITFGKINQSNLVIDLTNVVADVIRDENGNVSEQLGNDYLKNIVVDDCFYLIMNNTGSPHRNQTIIGGLWRPDLNAFQPPAPYPSWSFDDNTLKWNAPVPYPNDGKNYYWDEASQSWIEIPGVPQ